MNLSGVLSRLKFVFIPIGIAIIGFIAYRVYADTFSFLVTVSSVGPVFTVSPAENPASWSGAPTYEGQNVTFQATATDANGENYYLAVCKLNGITPVNGGAPVCASSTGTSGATSMAVDGSGNTYIGGTFIGTVNLGNGDVPVTSSNFYLAKYNPAGVLQWVRSEVSGSGDSSTHHVTVDSTGAVYAVGFFAGTVDIGAGSWTASSNDYFIVKYDANGNFQWADHENAGTGLAVAEAVVTDSNNNVFVGGYFDNAAVDFGAGSWTPSDYDYFLVKYDASGNFQWADREDGGTGAALLGALAVDAADNIYIAGHFLTAAVNFGAGSWTPSGGDYFIAKFDNNGVFQWADRENGGTGAATVNSLAIDALGNVYAAGHFLTAAVNFGAGSWTPTGWDYFIVKYNSAGVYQWADREDAGTGTASAQSVTTDSDLNVYLVGYFSGGNVNFGSGSWTASSTDYFVLKYDANGNFQWADREDSGTGTVTGWEVKVSADSVYVFGRLDGTADFGGGSITSSGGFDMILMRYDKDGGISWISPEPSDGTLCISSSTASGAQASCSYSTNALTPTETTWYAFVCDGNATSAQCSAVSQGSGNSGSTFYVADNPAPSITAGPAENPASHTGSPTYRGQNVTFQATATDATSEAYYLAICKLNGITPTAGGAPSCSSSFGNVVIRSINTDSSNNVYLAGYFSGTVDLGAGAWVTDQTDYFVAKFDSTGRFLWADHRNSGNAIISAFSSAVDASGNVFVAGQFQDGTVNIGAGNWTTSNQDYFVIKYDTNGNYQWADTENSGTGSSYVEGIDVDSSGNVYAIGAFQAGDVDFGAGSWTPTGIDYFIIKYNSSGAYQWVDREDAGTGTVTPHDIAVDNSGNSYITGSFQTGTINFGTGLLTPSGSDYFVVKYDTSGAFQWVDREDSGTGSAEANTVEVDSAGNVYVGGRFGTAAINFGAGAWTPSNFDYFFIKYNSAGTYQWVDRENGGTGSVNVYGIAFDSSDNPIIVGIFDTAAVNLGAGSWTPSSGDYFVLKYDSAGVYQWADREDSGTGNASANAIAVDGTGKIYVGGAFSTAAIDFGAGSWTPNGVDYFLVRYESDGTFEWSDRDQGGEWCISGSTASGAQASCNYTTAATEIQSNEWYAFVCDANASNPQCSAVSQGSGNSGSPFIVIENVSPTFSVAPTENPVSWTGSPTYKGQNVNFQATATDLTNENYYLAVCKLNEIAATNGGAPVCASQTGSVQIVDAVTDSSNNLYVVGDFTGTVNLGPGAWTASGVDYFIVKYDSKGAFMWADREDSGAGTAEAESVTVDSSGNVYVTGFFNTAAVDFGAGSWTPADDDYFIIKYTSGGAYQWADRENSGTGAALGFDVATDSSGNVYLAGTISVAAVDIGAGSWTPGGVDYFVIKYNSSGVYQWADRENSGTASVYSNGIAVDSSGNVYVAGYFGGAAVDLGAGSWTPSNNDYFVIKYDTNGVYQWADREDSGTATAFAYDVTVDNTGNVYVSGAFTTAAINIGAGSWTPSNFDYFVIKYNSSGVYQWADREDGGTGTVFAYNVVTDASGDVYVSGSFGAAAVNFGAGSWTPAGNDYFVMKYNSSGVYQWADRENGGTGNAYTYALAVDTAGNLYAAGAFSTAAVDFGSGSITPTSNDYHILKYSTSDGRLLSIDTEQSGAWCISTSTANGAQASCNYTTGLYEVESNDWYAFVCDGNAIEAKCSSLSQGGGNGGSTFIVVENAAPSYTAGPAENPASSITTPTYEGQNVTFQGTATDPNNANYYMAICRLNGITATNGGTPVCADNAGSVNINEVATDSSGNYYVTGRIQGTVDLGAGNWTASDRDFFVAKFNVNGELEWARREVSGDGDSYSNAIEIDGSGNVYVAGYFLTAAVDFGAGSWTPTGNDYFIVKYDSAGNFLWADREDSSSANQLFAWDIAVDNSGDVYLAGDFVGTVDVGAGSWVAGGASDYFVVKYNSSGVYQWADRENSGTGVVFSRAIDTDSSGNIYVTGVFSTAAVDFGAGSWTPSGTDYFVIKYNSAGVYQWADREDSGTGSATAYDVTVDGADNVYLAGVFSGAAVNIGAGSWTPSNIDYFVIKYNSSGVYQWADREDSGTGSATAYEVGIDASNNPYIAGYFTTAAVNFGAGSWTPSGTDYFVIKYDSAGAYQWADRENSGTGDAVGTTVTIDNTGNVYVGGDLSAAAVDFGTGSFNPTGNDFFLIRYDTNGNVVWVDREQSGAWCMSTATSSGAQASCSYTTTQYEIQNNPWYAFVCDADSLNAKCSLVSQGAGDSGSSFTVMENVPPNITVAPAENPASAVVTPTYEGSNVNFQVTATDPGLDSYYLALCKLNSVTANSGAAPTCASQTGSIFVQGVATDSGNNAFITGYFTGTVDLGAGSWTATNNDYFIVKLDSNGSFQWADRENSGNGSVTATEVAVDGSGNVFVVGYNETADIDIGAGTWTLGGTYDFFVIKYNNGGAYQWARRETSGSGAPRANDVAADSSGNVYVTGYFSTTAVDFGGGNLTPNATDYFIVKYDSAGAYQWADQENSGGGTTIAYSVSVDGSGNVYVAGEFSTSAVDFGAGSWTPSNNDYFIIKYNSSGVYQWADREDSGTGSAGAWGTAVDSSGNVYVVGYFWTGAVDIGAGSWTPGATDYFIIKYNSSGVYQWADREDGGTGDVLAREVAVDSAGNVYVAGFFQGNANLGAGSWSPTNNDYFVLKYNASGAYQWVDREDSGTGAAQIEGLAVDTNGNVYAGGYFSTAGVNFGPASWTPSGTDYVLLKYNSAGDLKRAEREDSGSWCISAATASGAQATCSYTTNSYEESNDWFAFVCDANSIIAKCSAANVGSGNSGSPFYVGDNVAPAFTAGPSENPASTLAAPTYAGANVTFQGTATDSVTSDNTYYLAICQTNGITPVAAGSPICNTPTGSSYVKDVASDSSGNVYVVGYYSGTVDIGAGSWTAVGQSMFVAKFNDKGTLLWADNKTSNAGAGISPTGIAVDSSGNVAVVGSFSGGTMDFGAGNWTANNNDFFVIKYNSSGTYQWANREASGTGNVSASSVAMDASGNVIVAGTFSTAADLGAGSWTPAGDDYFVVKYNSSGAYQWADREDGGTGSAFAAGVAADSSGNVYVTGTFHLAGINFGAGTLWTPSGFDYFVVKYNSSGAYQWSDREDSGTGDVTAHAIAADSSGNVYVTGFIGSTAVNIGAGSWTPSNGDYFIIKYDTSGAFQWADREDAGTGGAIGQSVKVDSNGNVFVGGYFQVAAVNFGAGSWTPSGGDYFVIKYNSSGAYQWVDREDSGTGIIDESNIAIGGANNDVYLGGLFYSAAVDFGSGSITPTGNNFMLLKYSNSGVLDWVQSEKAGAWCTSAATTTGTQASCTYTTSVYNIESNVWYAYVCDRDANYPKCSSANLGSGGSGSPFIVAINEVPVITVAPAENPASDGTTPTNEGANVTFQVTATDTYGDNYYLAVCRTNAVTPVNGGSPTCPGGNWCISSATASGVQASCTKSALNGDAESNAWYAFACDGNSTGALCTASSQGSGSSGSPFKVNHDPSFTAASTTAANYNPGATVTFQSTASDPDTDTAVDTVMLVVCKTTGISGVACDGGGADTWCASTAAASNPTCNATLPSVQPNGTVDAYVYVFDNHGLASTSATQGSNVGIVVNNVAPSITAITLNGGSDISLTENSTTNVPVTATVTDANSCQNISTVSTTVYRSGVGYAGCDTGGEANANSCYAVITCSVVGGSCTGSTDSSANYTCTVSMQYHADPTDTATQFTAQNWLNTVIAADGLNTTNTQIGVGVEVLSLIGYDTTGSIAYGNLTVGQSNSPLDKIVTITATGNVGLDVEFSGTNMTGPGTIAVGNQKHSLSSGTSYASGTVLTTTATEYEINVLKTTITGTPQTRNSYWGLLIPNGTIPGSYTGSNTVTAVKGESAQW